MSLIPGDAEFAIWAALIGLVGIGFWAEQHTRWGRRLTGIVVTMSLAMVLANIKVMPTDAAVYDTIFQFILPVAIPLMLFRADLRRIVREAGPTLIAFLIGAVGVVVGVVAANFLVPLEDIGPVIAGLYTATYIGGSANFAGVAIAADFQEGAIMSSAIAADIIATEIQMIVLIALPAFAFFQRAFVNHHEENAAAVADAGGEAHVPYLLDELNLTGLCLSLGTALVLVVAGDWCAALIDNPSMAILFTSAFALVIANAFPGLVERMSGDFEMALVLVFLFLAAIASTADVWVLAETGPVFFWYVSIVLGIHTVIVLALGWLLKIDLAELIIGSTACVGGSTSASAVASAKGWRSLIAPGILLGTLGNGIGTFIGVWIWQLLSA